MYPLWLAVLFGALYSAYLAIETPKQEERFNQARAEVTATNFVAYRRAIQKYIVANPAATGTISDASLAAYWLPGYIRDANWTNVISGGVLFVYSTAATAPTTKNTLFNKSNQSLMVGTKNAAGHLQSSNGVDTGITLPAAIANGAIVIVGL